MGWVEQMKIGELVRLHIRDIFTHCEQRDPAELGRLAEKAYAKRTFDINYPFCIEASQITPDNKMRYWRHKYAAGGAVFRVTSQWFSPSQPLFLRYLADRGIAVHASADPAPDTSVDRIPDPRHPARGRFKGNAIGNAQNLLVRNLLSRIGEEQFGEADWQDVVAEFGGRCAYCGGGGKLVMDHAVPINRAALGEHRLGNLVPSCAACNAKKHEQDYRTFLAGDGVRIAAVEAHMQRRGYVPLGENVLIKQVIDIAHEEVRGTADRYVKIIDALLARGDREPHAD